MAFAIKRRTPPSPPCHTEGSQRGPIRDNTVKLSPTHGGPSKVPYERKLLPTGVPPGSLLRENCHPQRSLQPLRCLDYQNGYLEIVSLEGGANA